MLLAAARDQGYSTIASLFSAVVLLLLIPYTMTEGGYYYDLPELLFFGLGVYGAARGWGWLVVLATLLGTWNKESFLFFVPTLYPLVAAVARQRHALISVGLALAGSVAINLYEHWRWLGNRGEIIQVHVGEQVRAFLRPTFLVSRDVIYGMTSPQAVNIVMLVALVTVVRRGWPALGEPMRHHCRLALAINLPLYLLFCAPGEIRNLSLLFPSFFMLLAAMLDRAQGYISPAVAPKYRG